MRTFIFRFAVSMACFMLTIVVNAYDFEVGGIYYDKNGSVATVSYNSSLPYSGDIVIPPTVTYDSTVYIVNAISNTAFKGNTLVKSVKIPESITSLPEYCFSGCSNLGSVDMSGNITVIGEYAFENCVGLAYVTIPSGVTSVANAFYGCTGLDSVSIPSTVTNISGAFYGCTGLRNVTIPSSLSVIGDYAFHGCTGLKSVSFPADLTSIGTNAFNGCTGLSSLSLPEGLVTVSQYAFRGCKGLTELVLPESITYFGRDAFENCTGLQTVNYNSISAKIGSYYGIFGGCNALKSAVIGEKVNTLPAYLFYNVSTLTSATISGSVISIGDYAFYGCKSLKELSIPKSVTTIGANAFSNCSGLSEINLHEKVISVGEYAFSGCAGIKTFTLPDKITSVSKGLLQKCTALTQVDLHDAVTSIGAYAFNGCKSLPNIELPEKVQTIGEYCFSDCSELTSIVLPDGITTVPGYCFSDCSKLSSVKLPANVTSLGEYSFKNCVSFTDFTILSGVTSVANAFYGCTGLDSVSIPSTVTNINGAFYGCTGLRNVTLPSSLSVIGDNAFYGCTGLKSVSFPADLTSIGTYAFNGCTGLSSLSLPEGLVTVSQYAFRGCKGLTELVLPESITYFGRDAFENCTGLQTVNYNSISAKIGSYYGIFGGCNALKSAVIGEKVNTLPAYLFYNVSTLTSVTISGSVISIGDYAFYGCTALKNIYSLASVPPVAASNTFYNVNKNTCNVYVADDVASAYKNAAYWNEFVNYKNGVCSVNVTAENGSVDGVGIYMKGATVTLTAVADNGYRFAGWYSDGKYLGNDNRYSFTVDSDVDIVAKFNVEGEACKVTVECGDNGTAKLSTTSVVYGGSVTLTITPDDYYETVSLKMNGLDVTAEITNGVYRLDNVTDSVCFEVLFGLMDTSDNTMYIEDISGSRGRKTVIPVSMVNADTITAFQFDLYLPEGVSVACDTIDDESVYGIEFADDRATSSHIVAASVLSNGALRVVAYSSTNKAFKNSDGVLVNITVNVDSDVEPGDYELSMKNIRLVSVAEREIATPLKTSLFTISDVTLGDVNSDTRVTMADVVIAVNYVLENNPSAFSFAAADINSDGKITMADVVGVVNIVLNGSASKAKRFDGNRIVAVSGNDEYLTMDNATSVSGKASLSVNLTNDVPYTAFQMDVELPDGVTLVSAALSNRASENHVIAWNVLSDGKVRVVAYSATNSDFDGSTGELLTLNVETKGAVSGVCDIIVDNVLLVTSSGSETSINGCGSLLDINGTTNISTHSDEKLHISVTDGKLVVESVDEIVLPVYFANGRIAETLTVNSGVNRYETLPAGIYIVNGVKVTLR